MLLGELARNGKTLRSNKNMLRVDFHYIYDLGKLLASTTLFVALCLKSLLMELMCGYAGKSLTKLVHFQIPWFVKQQWFSSVFY